MVTTLPLTVLTVASSAMPLVSALAMGTSSTMRTVSVPLLVALAASVTDRATLRVASASPTTLMIAAFSV